MIKNLNTSGNLGLRVWSEYGIYKRCTVMNRPSTVLSRVNNQSGFLSLSKHQPCLGRELAICTQGQLMEWKSEPWEPPSPGPHTSSSPSPKKNDPRSLCVTLLYTEHKYVCEDTQSSRSTKNILFNLFWIIMGCVLTD